MLSDPYQSPIGPPGNLRGADVRARRLGVEALATGAAAQPTRAGREGAAPRAPPLPAKSRRLVCKRPK